MPGRNRTGPMGMGPMTGRGAGRCTGYAGREAAYPAAGPGYGMGFGRGCGFGGGWRLGGGRGRGAGFRFGGYGGPFAYSGRYGLPDADSERQVLAHQADALQSELERVRKRLAAIEAEPAQE